MTDFSPREIVSELDRYIVGQNDAKRAVAVALRNRWRRKQLTGVMREEVSPKNILMIGPTGVGKTEIARRLAKLANAPFLKVEATKFTEVGYVGRDVDQIIRDLVEAGIGMVKVTRRKDVEAQAHLNAETRVLEALVGANASEITKENFRKKLRSNSLDDKEIEIQVADTGGAAFDIPGMPGWFRQCHQYFRHHGQGLRRAHQDAAHDGESELRTSDRRGKRQASGPGADQPGSD